mmetsp:Transcript_2204/g.6458  ORF Transcript_2204/g.6458 Transcript_2204/m.6458 type:complete len:218 (-) Transcript_2204:56-709(-)
MIMERRSPTVEAPLGSPFREQCLSLSASCLRFDAKTRPSMRALMEELTSWVDFKASRELGVAAVSSLLPGVTWEEGLRDHTADREAVGETVQVDALLEEDLVCHHLLGDFRAASGPGIKIGRSLRPHFADADAFVACLRATIFDLRHGVQVAPLYQRFGVLRLVGEREAPAPSGDAPSIVEAMACMFFPNESGAVSMKLTPCAPAGQGARAPHSIRL